MLPFLKTIILIFIMCSGMIGETLPLIQRYFHTEDMGNDYSRGTYLIILADAELDTILRDDKYGNFINFKKTQGYDVVIQNMADIGSNSSDNLQGYLDYYYHQEATGNMLEYVLLVGDVNGNFQIPSGSIRSYNENEEDVTDYPYTFFNNDDILNPDFFIGRWSIRSIDDLKKISLRTVQYVKMDSLQNSSYLNNALVVAGNFKGPNFPPNTWPVTPVWTSKWLMDELRNYGYSTIDTAFFHLGNKQEDNPQIHTSWNTGVGIINYRGWGDANGWHKPEFHRENITDWLRNGWYLPVVMSFVCNTGDYGNDYSGSGLSQSFGEYLITAGSINNPKGAVAMIGPSDLDTDTRFNNVMCAAMWDEMLEERIPEMAPALHAGKQALIKEFGNLEVNGTNIVEFYHHIYGVLGDPSLPVWLKEPEKMEVTLEDGTEVQNSLDLSSSFIYLNVNSSEGKRLNDVVGALLYNDEIIAKGLSNQIGELIINFDNVLDHSNLELYLNKPQYYQEKININYLSDNEDSPNTVMDYSFQSNSPQYNYVITEVDYNWKEINVIGDNLQLNDDSIIKNIKLNFDFRFYGSIFNTLTICSNGWISFLPCLMQNGQFSSCSTLPYFFNNSIPHPLGPYGMIAPFSDDLDDNQGLEPFDVYYWTNSTDSAIVEWDNVANGQTDENCPDCVKETFQVILTNFGVSTSSDGEIIFQYNTIHDIDDHGSTIGIESPDKNSGTEYLFNFTYSENVPVLQNSIAIKFSPQCAVDSVVDECGVCGGNGEKTWYVDMDDDGLGNAESATQSSCHRPDNYVIYSNDIDDNCSCIKNDESCYDCNDVCGGDAVVNDECGECGVPGETCLSLTLGLIPDKFSIQNIYPNPFNPVVTVSFAIPKIEFLSIGVFDIRGRKLATLANQNYHPGYYAVNWNAFDNASGLYFITLITSDAKLTQKVLLLK